MLALVGCGESDPLADEAAGESYIQERLAAEHPSRAPHEIAVLCRDAGSGRLSCGSSVTTGAAALRQRWAVALDGSGRVTAARPVGSSGEAERPAATEAGTPRRRARRLEIVTLRLGPGRRARVCVRTGRGRREFGTTRRAAISLRRARLRLEPRGQSTVVAVRGQRQTLDIRPGRLRPLRPRDRRC